MKQHAKVALFLFVVLVFCWSYAFGMRKKHQIKSYFFKIPPGAELPFLRSNAPKESSPSAKKSKKNGDAYNQRMLDQALLNAVEKQDYKLTKEILEKKANPNCYNFLLQTPLHIASKLGNLDLVILLLQFDAYPWLRNGRGAIPAFSSIVHGHDIITKLFFSLALPPIAKEILKGQQRFNQHKKRLLEEQNRLFQLKCFGDPLKIDFSNISDDPLPNPKPLGDGFF